jgi:hypothetical protein
MASAPAPEYVYPYSFVYSCLAADEAPYPPVHQVHFATLEQMYELLAGAYMDIYFSTGNDPHAQTPSALLATLRDTHCVTVKLAYFDGAVWREPEDGPLHRTILNGWPQYVAMMPPQ